MVTQVILLHFELKALYLGLKLVHVSQVDFLVCPEIHEKYFICKNNVSFENFKNTKFFRPRVKQCKISIGRWVVGSYYGLQIGLNFKFEKKDYPTEKHKEFNLIELG